jgi:tRNA pseudouridine55 synthase
MNGVIVADKPAGWTSHDVVAKVKRTLKAAKVGHLGTLDPMATGVLPLVINGATKFARFLDGGVKAYEAELRLGVETDTLDGEGRVTGSGDTDHLDDARILDAFGSFKGRISQTPPMFSSVKMKGTPLYKLARKGMVVERASKEVDIFDIEVTDISVPYVRFKVGCSRGTYIRALASDIGKLLGCGAHLSRLRRTISGEFNIDEGVSPDLPVGSLTEALIPLESALKRAAPNFTSVEVAPDEAARVTDRVGLGGFRVRGFFPFLGGAEVVRFTFEGTALALAEHKGMGQQESLFNVKFVFSAIGA